MSEEVDPFTLLTPEERRARLQEIAAEELRPRPIQTPPRRSTHDQKRLFVGGAVIGLVVILVAGVVGANRSGTTATPTPTSSTAAKTVAATPAPSNDTPTASTDPDVRADGGLDYLGLKAEAEEKLDGVLSDDHSVRYRDVHTKLSTMDGGGIVAFCGLENSRTPEGGYGGFQRFIASRSVAVTEDRMPPADFEQAWGSFCENGVEGPQVWF